MSRYSEIIDEADRVLTLPGGAQLPFRCIPSGSFWMGSRGENPSEEPRQEMIIAQDFECSSVPVTQECFREWTDSDHYKQWFDQMGKTLCSDGKPHRNSFDKGTDLPTEQVTWYEASEYANWLNEVSASELNDSGLVARLPWEAEWEYTCRGGTETEYYTGDGEEALLKAGWFDGNSESQTHPVGELAPNALGLYDMHGNVWEWCDDVWDAKAYRKRGSNSAAWNLDDAGSDAEYWRDDDRKAKRPVRVFRGGSWNVSAWGCRSAFRGWRGPSFRFGYRGFRLVLAPVPEKPGRGAQKTSKAEPGRGAVSDGTERKAEGAGGAGTDELLKRGTMPKRPA